GLTGTTRTTAGSSLSNRDLNARISPGADVDPIVGSHLARCAWPGASPVIFVVVLAVAPTASPVGFEAAAAGSGVTSSRFGQDNAAPSATGRGEGMHHDSPIVEPNDG